MEGFEYTEKYYQRFIRRTESKPAPMRLIMERTFHSAVWVLETIDGANSSELESAVNLFISNLKNKEFALTYRGQLKIAWTDADKFVFGLHAFYNDLASKIKKRHKEQAIADFISEVMRYQVDDSASVYNKAVTAYINMMLQTLEYLRPDKFAFDKSIYGVDDKGGFLLGPCPFPYSDVPMIKLNRMMHQSDVPINPQEKFASFVKECSEQGIQINSMEDFSNFERAQRIHVTTIASMLFLIKRDTYDMLPKESYYAQENPIGDLMVPVKMEFLCERLKEKVRRISDNGITFFFDDPECLLKFLSIREIYKKEKTYILYRLSTAFGDLSGYYDLEDDYFYSIFAESENKYCYEVVKALVLSLYASQIFSEFPPLNEVIMRLSGPIPVGVLDEESVIVEACNESMQAAFEQLGNIADDDKPSVSCTAAKEINNMGGEDTNVIYPFTWYRVSQDKTDS